MPRQPEHVQLCASPGRGCPLSEVEESDNPCFELQELQHELQHEEQPLQEQPPQEPPPQDLPPQGPPLQGLPLDSDSPAQPISSWFASLIAWCWCLKGSADETAEAKEAACKTHYWANFIPRVQCFLLPTNRLVERYPLEEDRQRIKSVLGICVRFVGRQCDESCHKCDECGTCPHQYACDCSEFHKHDGSWCAHIHLMHMLTKGRFRGRVCLYIQTDLRYTQIRHLRAYVLGQRYMSRRSLSADVYQEEANYLDVLWAGSPHKAIRLRTAEACSCPDADRCGTCTACRCKFTCTCPDFQADGQVCQHVHSVAMLDGDNLFRNYTLDPPPPYVHIEPVTPSKDWTVEFCVAFEHEMSFYFNLNNIDRIDGDAVAGLPAWGLRNLEPSGEKDLYIVFHERLGRFVVESNYKPGRLRSCRCKHKSPSSVCDRCGICAHYYDCDCAVRKDIVCRHAHAVHRLRTNCAETQKKAELYARRKFSLPAVFFMNPLDSAPEAGPADARSAQEEETKALKRAKKLKNEQKAAYRTKMRSEGRRLAEQGKQKAEQGDQRAAQDNQGAAPEGRRAAQGDQRAARGGRRAARGDPRAVPDEPWGAGSSHNETFI